MTCTTFPSNSMSGFSTLAYDLAPAPFSTTLPSLRGRGGRGCAGGQRVHGWAGVLCVVCGSRPCINSVCVGFEGGVRGHGVRRERVARDAVMQMAKSHALSHVHHSILCHPSLPCPALALPACLCMSVT